MSSPVLRLIADDLTGALDSAVELTGLCGSAPLRWTDDAGLAGSLAVDAGTREAPREGAVARLRRLAPMLCGADIAFKKIDSLLRGHVAAELAACMAAGDWRHVVLALAFPSRGASRVAAACWCGRPAGRRSKLWHPRPPCPARKGRIAGDR